MTTVELPASMKADVLDVRLFAPGQLVDLIRSVNVERAGHAGIVWFLRHGTDPDAPGLTAGVRGDLGALDWFGETATEIPMDGRNPDDVDYFTPSGHHNAMPPGSELPVERVLEAVAEFARTGARPTSIHWRPEDDAGGARLVLVAVDDVRPVTTTFIGMELVREVARLLDSENIRSTRLGGDLTLWHAEGSPGRPNPVASSLAAQYDTPPVAGPAVISGPIMDNTVHPLTAEDADRLATRLRGNGVTPSPAEDCTSHSPCRELLGLPAAQRESLFRLIPARTSDLGPDAIYIHLNNDLVALLVAMGPGESGSFQQAYPVLGHLAARWHTTPADLITRAIENMRAAGVSVESHDQGEYSPLYVVVDQGVSGVAQLVRLEELLGTDLPYGAIVGIPREHQIIAVPIRKARDLATIEPVLRLVRNVGSNALDRVSLDVHWLHRGRLHPLHAEARNGQLEQIFPPDEFQQLIEQLPRD